MSDTTLPPERSAPEDGLSLSDAVELVKQFHERIGASVAAKPKLLPCQPEAVNRFAVQILELSLVASQQGAEVSDQVLLRLGMALEEISEWLAAHAQGDVVAAADAWTDRFYVLFGDAVSTGLPAESLFREVHASNMTKEAHRTDWPGKAVRSESYRPPDIRGVLRSVQMLP